MLSRVLMCISHDLVVEYEILVVHVVVIYLVLIFIRFKGLGFVSHGSLSIF
ncbi:hypothetical protein Hanom_Chr00s064683g01786501 [Helianthus anomalus]